MMGQGSVHWTSERMESGERLSAAMDSDWHADTDLSRSTKGLDASAREDWALYHLIGDALRSEDLAMSPMAENRFATALSARLESEPTFVAAPASRAWATPKLVGDSDGMLSSWFARHGRMMPSFAAAAAVATLAWVLVPSMHGTSSGRMSAPIAALSAPSSSHGNWQRVNLSSDHALDPYLQAHQQFATDGGGLGYASYSGSGSVEN